MAISQKRVPAIEGKHMMKMIYDLQSEEFNFLSCMHVYEISIPSFSNEAMYV